MPSDVEYSPVGEGLGMRDFWLYAWMRRAAVFSAHLTSLTLTITVSVLSRPGTSLFSWHPVCMTVAFCVFMTEGVLLFSAEGSPFCFKSRKGKVRVHWLCQVLVLTAAATGLGFIVASKSVSEHPHLTSWHSLLGSCTLASTLLQAVFGISVTFHKELHLSLPPSRLKLVPRHLRVAGLPAGHRHRGVRPFLRLVPGQREGTCVVGLIAAALLPCFGSDEPDHKRLPAPQEDEQLGGSRLWWGEVQL
ncbi:Cytochrome b561 domain-containing protein 1 [Oryzias melastigma]|uniref:ascorbate ferrireductase (transmembrane) n=1 Tax=Oryzias melastigma TaxID=30732 RepID=A0A834FEY8_ORYME|nr:Cytochrome b561 domain-containing protein 1 [Oryzias melastigma]